MLSLAAGCLGAYEFYFALPAGGVFFDKAINLVGQDRVFEIPHRRLELPALLKILRICNARGIDVVHSHGKGAGIYARALHLLSGVKAIHTLHGIHDGAYGRFGRFFYRMYEKCGLFFTNALICVSPSEFQQFISMVGDNKKIHTILNGTEPYEGELASPRSNKIVIVARFTYQKNIDEVLDIAEAMPEHCFEIFGDGEDFLRIQRALDSRAIGNVVLHGAVTNVRDVIADASVFLSTARWEGLPLAPLEAMSVGVPVVASFVPGNKDAVIDGESGFLYPLGDIGDAKEKILKAKLINRGRVREVHKKYFATNRMCAATASIYSAI
jgi:glycosyltransferase involved in cell wall biosynthesis